MFTTFDLGKRNARRELSNLSEIFRGETVTLNRARRRDLQKQLARGSRGFTVELALATLSEDHWTLLRDSPLLTHVGKVCLSQSLNQTQIAQKDAIRTGINDLFQTALKLQKL